MQTTIRELKLLVKGAMEKQWDTFRVLERERIAKGWLGTQSRDVWLQAQASHAAYLAVHNALHGDRFFLKVDGEFYKYEGVAT